MTTYGVTPQGFVVKPLTAITASLTARLLAKIPPDTDVSADQPLGQLLGVIAAEIAPLWELGNVAYNTTNRGDAEGDLLDNIGGITGTKRAAQRPSTVLCAAAFSTAGTYAKGALAAYVAGTPSQQWTNANAITAPSTGGDGVNPISTTNTWPCLSGANGTLTYLSGTVTLTWSGGAPVVPTTLSGQNITIAGAATAGNNGTFSNVTVAVGGLSISWSNADGATDANNGAIAWLLGSGTTFEWDSTADGETYGDALVAANTAAYAGSASLGYGQLNQLVPVSGWTAIADVTGVAVGALVETDTPYRVRQEQELSAPGSSTLDALAAAILQALDNAPVPPLASSVTPYENTGLTEDVNGLPGKSFMMVVYDGQSPNTAQNDPLIAAAIWANKPAGMQSFGNYPVQTPDSNGNLETVYFKRPLGVRITLTITVAVSAAMTAPEQTALKAAISVALINATQGQPYTLYGTTIVPPPKAPTTFAPGVDVIAGALKGIVQGQAGVIDVPTFTVGATGATPAPDGNVPIGVGQLPTLASGDIAVTCSTFNPGSP